MCEFVCVCVDASDAASSYYIFWKEIVDWFNAIRAARFHYLQVAFPVAAVSEVHTHTHTRDKSLSTVWSELRV